MTGLNAGRGPRAGVTSLAAQRPVELVLAHPEVLDAETLDHPAGLLDDAKAMELAEWCYYNVEEVWSGFNLLAEAVARGFRITAPTKALQRDVDAWSDRVRLADAVRMWVKGALIYGRSHRGDPRLFSRSATRASSLSTKTETAPSAAVLGVGGVAAHATL